MCVGSTRVGPFSHVSIQILKSTLSAAWNGIFVPTKPVLSLLSHIAYGYFNWTGPAAACASVPPVGGKKLDGKVEYWQMFAYSHAYPRCVHWSTRPVSRSVAFVFGVNTYENCVLTVIRDGCLNAPNASNL